MTQKEEPSMTLDVCSNDEVVAEQVVPKAPKMPKAPWDRTEPSKGKHDRDKPGQCMRCDGPIDVPSQVHCQWCRVVVQREEKLKKTPQRTNFFVPGSARRWTAAKPPCQ